MIPPPWHKRTQGNSHNKSPRPQGHKRPHNKWKSSSFPYPVDYNDHFETPLQAYQDIQPLIQWMLSPHDNPVLYDPYYCDGATQRWLHQLGFPNVIHHKRDFYHDIDHHTVPAHDCLITNPPYSDVHKKKCLDYAMGRLARHNTPFVLLLPTYVATKAYYRACLDQHGLAQQTMAYLVPPQDYSYHHPAGTGKDLPPFASMWFCGLPRGWHGRVRDFWEQGREDNIHRHNPHNEKRSSQPQLFLSLTELQHAKVVDLHHRPNPKQRKKKQKRLRGQASAGLPPTKNPSSLTGVPSLPISKKESKYRDANGQRKRKRF